MTVKVRERDGYCQYDIRFRWPDGSLFRERKRSPVASRSGTKRWAEERERELIKVGKQVSQERANACVTLAAFWPRLIADHYKANRLKASTIDEVERMPKRHFVEIWDLPLNQITNSEIAALRGRLAHLERKTVNNVLAILSRALGCAVEWGVIAALPCKITMFPISDPEMKFFEHEVYRDIVEAAAKISPEHKVLVLFAGSAGLRRGEIRALKWTDLDLKRGLIHVRRAFWLDVEGLPKGGRTRDVPMTPELLTALKAIRSLKERVFEGMSNHVVRTMIGSVMRRAGLEGDAIHIFRHTFCSHIALAGVTARAIQELAGHADISTTQKYMHLAPSDKTRAIAMLSSYSGTGLTVHDSMLG